LAAEVKSMLLLLLVGLAMFAYRNLHWFACATLVSAGATNPALALHGSHVLTTSSYARVYVVEIEGRKGTRNYAPDNAGAATEPTDTTSSRADTSETRQERIEQCMASWDSKTHITKSSWRKICERQLSE
jgi:hypothetical protein